jgi:hypothetical protein
MEWISIDEKLPPETKPVLYCMPAHVEQWSISGGKQHSGVTEWTVSVGLWKKELV